MAIFFSKAHSWITLFVRETLPRIPYHKYHAKAYEKFQDYTGIVGDNMRNVFFDGNEPYIRLDDTAPDYGNTEASGNFIKISRVFADELEAVLPSNKLTTFNRHRRDDEEPYKVRHDVYAPSELETKLMLILESTILHELVHYVRRTYNPDAAARYRSRRGRSQEEEIADAFEVAAYGKSPNVSNIGIAAYMPLTYAAHDKVFKTQ